MWDGLDSQCFGLQAFNGDMLTRRPVDPVQSRGSVL